VVQACLKCGVRRLVHFSTIEALLPYPPDEPVDESRPLIGAQHAMPLQMYTLSPYAYTKAAAEELKSRIRNNLLETRRGFIEGKSDDALIAALIRNDQDQRRAVRILSDAIVDYDQSSIYTIHGFCQRILHENAFETGNLYDTELITDPTEIYREVADDFWRIRFYDAQPEFIRFAAEEHRAADPSYFFRLHTGVHALDLDVLPSIVPFQNAKSPSFLMGMFPLNRYRMFPVLSA